MASRDEARNPEDRVHMHLVVVEQRDAIEMRAREEIEDVGAGPAQADDGDLLAAQKRGEIVDVIARGHRVGKA